MAEITKDGIFTQALKLAILADMVFKGLCAIAQPLTYGGPCQLKKNLF